MAVYHPIGSGPPLQPDRCKAGVWSKDRWACYSQCARRPESDGWCKQHNPEAEAERKRGREARYEAQRRKDAMGWYGELWLTALAKIRDGDNDPRETARLALECCGFDPR